MPSPVEGLLFVAVLLEGSMYKKPLIVTEFGTCFVNLDGK